MGVSCSASIVRQISHKGVEKTECMLLPRPYPFCPEKEGTLQMYINFRILSKKTKIDLYPITRIYYILDSLCKLEFFQKLA